MEPAKSISSLVMMLTSDHNGSTNIVVILQAKNILPKSGFWQNCHEEIKGEMKSKGTFWYWSCKTCNVKESLKYETILYDAKLKLINFTCLVYCFTEKNQTNCQISKKTSFPQENYQVRTTISRTIIRGFKIGKFSNFRF